MPLSDLTDAEKQVVRTCLEVVAAGDIVEHDIEFHAVMGIDPDELRAILAAWPYVDDATVPVWLAINNSFNNLLNNYPKSCRRWEDRIPVAREEARTVFEKWRNRPAGAHGGD